MNKNYKILTLLFLLVSFWFLSKTLYIDFSWVEENLKRFPYFYSGIIFVIIYVIGTFFIWFSKDSFRFLAAILFGPYLSTILVFIAELINAFILFYLARILGREYVEKRIKNKNFYFNLDKKVTNLNLFWLILLRTTPLVPFRFLDLVSGLTGISFRRYLIVVVLGSPLRIFWLQYILSGVGRAIFYDPNLILEFIFRNSFLYVLTLLYIILIIFLAKKLKNVK